MAEIGSIRATRRTVTPATPSVNSEAFGSGVAQALGSLGQTMQTSALLGVEREAANTSMDLAYRDRQDKLTRAQKTIEFMKIQNDLRLGLTEDYKAAEPGAPELTNSTKAKIDDRMTEFLRSVPEHMRPAFETEAARVGLELTNTAFGLQIDAENSEYTRNAVELQTQIVNDFTSAVITGSVEDTLNAIEDDALEQVGALLAASPLGTVATRALSEQIRLSIKASKMARLGLEEQLDNASMGGTITGRLKTENGVVSSKAPVVAGLPAAAVGFLTATAGPESNGEYNRMYAPEGSAARYFSDFSEHPNSPAMIVGGPNDGKVSTAAGKYQMIYSTWMEAKTALGLPDFSPESQDLAAWWLAKRDYAKKTGRDLEMVLSSGHAPSIAAAKQLLTSTWEGLGNLNVDSFIDTVSNATGNISSLIDDEEFQDIPLDARLSIMLGAQDQAQGVKQKMAADAAAEQARVFEQMKQLASRGEVSALDITNFINQQDLSLDSQEELRGVYDKYNETVVQSSKFLTGLSDPSKTFSASDEDDKGGANAILESTNAAQHLLEGNEEYVDSFLVPTYKQINYIPNDLVTMLSRQSASQDPNDSVFAMQTMAKLAASTTDFERAFGADMTQNVALFNAAQGSLPQEQVMAMIKNSQDPATKALNDERRKAIGELVKKNPDLYTPRGMAAKMEIEGAMDFTTANSLYSETKPVFDYMFAHLGDEKKAWEATTAVISKRWGMFEVNGEEQTMRLPPSITATPFNGSLDYVTTQLQETFGFTESDSVELISDDMTSKEYYGGRQASYKLARLTPEGIPEAMYTYDMLPGFDPKTDKHLTGVIVRWSPRITNQMQMDQVLNVELETEIRELTRQSFEAPLRGENNVGIVTAKIQALRAAQGRGVREAQTDPTFFKPVISGLNSMYGEDRDEIIQTLRDFKPASAEEAKTKLLELEDKLNGLFPVFQRWEVQARIKDLLKEIK